MKRRPGPRTVLACAVGALIISCQPPLDVPDRYASYSEIESVWQYLTQHSIYQDRVPQDPFVFSTSTALLLSLNDTLKGYHFTRYGSEKAYLVSRTSGAVAGAPAKVSLSPGPNSTVVLDTLTDSVGLITLWTFDSACVFTDFLYLAGAASRFPKLVINIRNNGGGYINLADSVIAALVPAGTAYIQARERDYDENQKKYVTLDWHPWTTRYGPRPEFAGKKFAVLMNGNTASASEFVAAALYEGDTATRLIGQPTFGKAMGQVEIIRRRDMRYVDPYLFVRPLYITYLQISGVSSRIGEYHHIGIQPDTVPTAYVAQGAGLSSDWQRQIFYAVKMLDSTAAPGSISYPPSSRDSLGLRKTVESGMAKVIYEE